MFIQIIRLTIAFQGLYASIQSKEFGQGRCVVSRGNTKNSLGARHSHNTPCTAGIGLNQFQFGSDRFIARHLDYLLQDRNGECISRAPQNTTCENVHLYRRARTPYLSFMEVFWKKSDSGQIPDIRGSARHAHTFSSVLEMDMQSIKVGKTHDYGISEDSGIYPLSRTINGSTYYFFMQIITEKIDEVELIPFRRYNAENSVQFTIQDEEYIFSKINGYNGSTYKRSGIPHYETNFGFSYANAYVSYTNDSTVESGIVLALPLEVVYSNGLENISNENVLQCGAIKLDDDPGGSFSPFMKDRHWVMPTKECEYKTSETYDIFVVSL